MNPDPLRPPETDRHAHDWVRCVTCDNGDLRCNGCADHLAVVRGPVVPVVPLVIALGVIVGILVAWAVR